MFVRGVEAIKLYMPPPTDANIDTNIREEKGRATTTISEIESTMSSVERYRQEWRQLLLTLDENPESIRDLAFNGELKVSKFRSVYWALLLRVLSADHRNAWQEQRKQQRERYEKLKQEFVKNPHETAAVTDDDPLSQSTQSVWNQYFSDQELFTVIRQDVVRTFPGVDFFRKTLIQNAMTNILFYYAREHPYMCYRQGMHEILAPILFVIYGDHQSLLHYRELAKTEIDEILLDVLNPEYLEADSYSIFSRVMSSIESYYRITNFVPIPGGYVAQQSEAETRNNPSNATGVEVIGQLNSIRDKILAKEDLHLHNYLLKLDIPLHIFGIRWLRLLFGREFPLLDLLVLWDAIFADSDHFDLPNYILVAMLIRIRDKLLLSDQTTCLTYLMRYPSNVDVNLILRHALHMLMPKKFDLPSNAFVYCTIKPNENSMMHLSKHQQQQQHQHQPTNTSRRLLAPEDHQSEQQQHRARSTSLGDAAAKVERQIALLQARNAAEIAVHTRLKMAGTETNHLVMDGYAKNQSPEVMRLELKNAQTVITVARNKLQSYLAIVRRNVEKIHSDELTQALDGIDELCTFLDVKFMFPLHGRTVPIDQAHEADEQHRVERQMSRADNTKSIKRNATLEVKANTTSSTSTSMAQSSFSIAAAEKKQNMSNPSNTILAAPSGSYEKPDNSFMASTGRLLGNIREIELMTIASDEKIEQPSNAGRQQHNEQNSAQKNGGGRMPLVDPLRPNIE